MGFRPIIRITSISETQDGWSLHLNNTANAALRVVWGATQPSAGRVLAEGREIRLGRNETAVVSVSKSGLEPHSAVEWAAELHYDGSYAAESPPIGRETVRLYDVVGTPQVGPTTALLLMVSVFVGWRRRHR